MGTGACTRRHWLAATAWGLPGVLGGVFAGLWPRRGAAGGPGAPIDWPALSTVQGEVLPPAHWQGVPAVVVFWATWCGYCRRHNVHVERLYRTVSPQRLRVLGVAIDEDVALVQRHVRQAGHSFPVVADGAGLRRRFTGRRLVPITCTVGADGRLLQVLPGEMSEDDVMSLARLALPAR